MDASPRVVPPPSGVLRVSLLGEQMIGDAAGTVGTRSSRTVALLAFLVVHAGAPQSRQRIAGLFWPDSTDEQALTNLRRELHHLRQVLARSPSLVVTARELAWHDSETCVVDVRVFAAERSAALAATTDGEVVAHAAAAVKHYRGELLPGGFDDWLLDARSELEGQCVELLDLLGETRARTGDLTGAVDAVRRRIRLRPLEEIGYRTLMELQGELGDRAGAVSTYHHSVSVLERELGVEPDPATRAALNQLLAREGPAVPAPRPPRPAQERSGRAEAQLVGRAAELGVLTEQWRRAAAGSPTLVVVRGDAGVGKTRLVADVAAAAGRAGAVVANARCFGTPGRLALSPVADWLRTPAVQSGLAALDPVWRTEVDRLVPSGAARAEQADGSRAMVDAWQRHRFFEGIARALIDVDRPLLLVLDNLHWCDQETLAFLTFCLGLADGARVMVVATERTGDGQEPGLAEWTARMRATGLLTELALTPLDAGGTAQLTAAITGRPLAAGDAELLHATTGGFPLYVVEAARSSVDPDDGDPGSAPLPIGDLTAVLQRRLDRVGPAARDVVGLAAAVGRTFTLDLLTEASDLDADSVVAAVDELWRRRIVRYVGNSYDFSHDLLRDAAYARISPPQRWLLHRRLAQGLELLHGDDPDAVAGQLAEQYARGGRGERAVGYYRRAAEIAAGTFAHGEAVRLYREALTTVRTLPAGRERSRQELTLLEAVAAPLNAHLGYSSPDLRSTLERTIGLAEELGQRDAALTGLIGLWMSVFVGGDMAAARRIGVRALALVEPGSGMSGPAHHVVGGSEISLGRPASALEHWETANRIGGFEMLTVGTRSDVHQRAWAAHAHWLLGHDAAALTSRDDAVALARSIGNPYSLAVALAYAGITSQLLVDLPGLADSVAELAELCARYDFAYYREWALVLGGWQDGDLDRARAGVDRLRAAGALARMPYWLSLVADLLGRTGRPGDARATLDAALVAARARDDLWWLPEVLRMRAAYDDGPAAVERLLAAARLATEHGSVALAVRCAADLAARGVPAAP